MGRVKKDEIVVGLDIGTTKIAAIVGEVTEEGIDIIGIGTSRSRGLRKGVVINIDATVHDIQQAIREAEHMAGCDISTVYAGIAGGHIRGLNSHGIVAVKDKEVRDADVQRVIEAAKAVAIPMDREVLHVLPQQYIIDEQDGVRDPLGMSGVRLEAKVHIATTSVTSAQNVVKCANRCGLQVADIVLEPLASAEAVVEDDEKELGVALVDIGGGTTDIVIFCDGAIVHTAVLPLGGSHLTGDIAVGLRTPLESAEKIKKKYGCALPEAIEAEETMEGPVGGRARAAPSVAPRARRDRADAARGDVRARQARDPAQRLPRVDRGRRGHDRRLDPPARAAGAGRVGARPPGPARRAARHRRAGRRGAFAGVLDRRRPRALRRARHRAGSARERAGARQRDDPPHAQLDRGDVLRLEKVCQKICPSRRRRR